MSPRWKAARGRPPDLLKAPEDRKQRIRVNLAPELNRTVRARAADSGRSLSTELEFLIERGLASLKPVDALTLRAQAIHQEQDVSMQTALALARKESARGL